MEDEQGKVTPLWKRNFAPEKRAAKASIKHALLNAFDKLGNEAFFIRLGNGSAEDRRCLAMILAKLVPLEVQGTMDHSLTVKIVKQVGGREILIDTGKTANLGLPPKDAATGKRLTDTVSDEVVVDA